MTDGEPPVDLTEVFRLDLEPADRVARELSVGVARGAFADAKLRDRFIAKIDACGGPDACWVWTAYRMISGYGRFPGEGAGLAHRIAFAWAVEPVLPGQVVRHVECGNPGCTNPAHLAQGTNADNSADMIRDGHGGRRVLSEDDLAILDRMYWRVYKNAKKRRGRRPTQASVLKNLAREFDASPGWLATLAQERNWSPGQEEARS